MSTMMDLLKELYPLKLAPVSEDTDKAVSILCRELPFEVHEYVSGLEHNGWIVPKSWKVIKAEIRKNGKLIYDGTKHPLGVMGYAKSFQGRVKYDELVNHLTFRPDWPEAIGYHCDYYYKPWLSNWGFSLPYSLFKNLGVGEYEIDLRTSFEQGTLKVCEFTLKGESNNTIIFNAHNCHAAQANDDIAGVVVAIEIIKRLAQRKTRKYSYKIIIAPEHLGTVFFLADQTKAAIKTFKYAFFLEMLGNDNRFALQESFHGDSLIDKAAHHYLKHNSPGYHHDKFRKIVGNDETVWEAPGYEIPTVSLSRAPYAEYHTSLDNEDIIHDEKLEESVQVMLGIIEILENNYCLKRKFEGLLALSNPKYDLYLKPGTDPSMQDKKSEEMAKWNYLMDCLPRYFDEKTSALEIAERHELPFDKVFSYISKFRVKGLIEFRRK